MSDSDEMDSILEYVLLGAREFLLLRFRRAMHLRQMLSEARSGWCLSACGKPPSTFDRGPGSLPRVDGRGGKDRQVVKSCPSTLNRRVEN
jgi:hypothetical protein